MTHVKICGFQTSGPAIAAAEAGADALGFVFVPNVRRALTMEAALVALDELRTATFGSTPEIVGLFADQPVEHVRKYILALNLDAVQLCGSESVGYAKALEVPSYKVIAIDPQVPISAQMPRIMVLQHRHQLAGQRIVMDAAAKGEYGGTGTTFDWALAAEFAQGLDFSLAGGLDPDNVVAAVTQVRPWGVDTSSGVETDGEKDNQKVQTFVQEVRETDRRLSRGFLSRVLGNLFPDRGPVR